MDACVLRVLGKISIPEPGNISCGSAPQSIVFLLCHHWPPDVFMYFSSHMFLLLQLRLDICYSLSLEYVLYLFSCQNSISSSNLIAGSLSLDIIVIIDLGTSSCVYFKNKTRSKKILHNTSVVYMCTYSLGFFEVQSKSYVSIFGI